MTPPDPYAILGVPRSASRDEIARAYRRLAKQHHPDAGAPPSPTMGRINEAWRTLSSPTRRAEWDRAHAAVAPPHWVTPVAEPSRRPAAPAAPPSRWDSPWRVAGIVLGVVALVSVVMVGLFAAASPADDRGRFEGPELAFRYPATWMLRPGDGTDAPRHRVLAHLVSFGIDEDEWCTSFADPCALTDGAVPAGTASVVITSWEDGTPPVPRPGDAASDVTIGGRPAAFELRRLPSGPGIVAWWQLSPPGFPDRWIEVRADIGGRPLETDRLLQQIRAVLETVEFVE